MNRMFKVLKHILLIVTVLAGAFHASGQIAMPDQVCVGATKNYWVDETPGSTYNWAINGVGQPVTGLQQTKVPASGRTGG